MYIELLIAQVLSVIHIKPFHFPGFRRLSSIRRSTKHSLFGTHQRKKNGKRTGPLRAMLNFIFWIAFFSIIRSVLFFLLYLIKVWNLSLILISNFNFRQFFTYRECLSEKFRPQQIKLNAHKYQLHILHEHQHLVTSYKRTASKQSSLLWLQSASWSIPLNHAGGGGYLWYVKVCHESLFPFDWKDLRDKKRREFKQDSSLTAERLGF